MVLGNLLYGEGYEECRGGKLACLGSNTEVD